MSVSAAPAAASCGGVEHFWPRKVERKGAPPLALGDSIMLGAAEPLQRAGFEVDVRGCRQMSEGLQVLASRVRSHSLPSVVVVGLGTNWTVTTGQVRAAMRILGENRVKVVDWAARSAGRSDWVWSDGLHLQPAGARALARLMSVAFTWPLPGVEATFS
ncbi:MAG TPA: hypothetical protein VER75_09820, partial [Thermoleophilaceae bacterium]|nr:hypothetical protein [Thermoleophilaceae bacterium]